MEAVDVFPGGLGARECPDLATLYRRPGPFASCYFDTEAQSENAPRKAHILWKDLRRLLEAEGSDEASLAALEAVVATSRRRGEAAGAIAAKGEVLLVEAGRSPLGFGAGVWGPLPALAPVIRWRQRAIAHITVACDRAGADITGVAQGGVGQLLTSAGDEDRHDPELHKVRVGGWSQRRIERRVENAWERNARAVVAALDELVAKLEPRLIVYGGDPHACNLLEVHASASWRDLLHHLPLSRAADGSDAHDAREVARAVATVTAADTARLIAHWKEMKAKKMGAEGARDVLAAFTASAVETVLVHDDLGEARSDRKSLAYFCTDPLVFGTERAAVAEVARAGKVEEARLADVAIGAAFLTGASVRVVPGGVIEDGVAALLRFPGPY
jgi:hypothetical protein